MKESSGCRRGEEDVRAPSLRSAGRFSCFFVTFGGDPYMTYAIHAEEILTHNAVSLT